MLCGELPTASSQLEVTRPFVLRHLHKGLGAEVLDLVRVRVRVMVRAPRCSTLNPHP